MGMAGKHSAERWQRCWGGSAGRSLAQTRASIAQMLKVATRAFTGALSAGRHPESC